MNNPAVECLKDVQITEITFDETKDEDHYFEYSENPKEAVEQVVEELPKMTETNQTFYFFIGNLLKKSIVGHDSISTERFENELTQNVVNSCFRAQQINALGLKLLSILVGELDMLCTADGKREDLLTDDMKKECSAVTSPKTLPVTMCTWDEKIKYATEQIHLFVNGLYDKGDHYFAHKFRAEAQDLLLGLIKGYSDREGRASKKQCTEVMSVEPPSKKLKAYLKEEHGEKFLKKFKKDLERKEPGPTRENHFIRRMSIDPRHLAVLLDHLLLMKRSSTTYQFFIEILQRICERKMLPRALNEFQYGFLPHELVCLAKSQSVFQKQGFDFIVEAIDELGRWEAFVEAGQPIMECASGFPIPSQIFDK